MNNNLFYFEYSKQNPEKMLDPFYAKKMTVINQANDQTSELIEQNNKLLEHINTFKHLRESGEGKDDKAIKSVIDDVISLLNKTKNINYSPFSQFFMVYNSTYSEYTRYSKETKKEFIFEMLEHYCNERHSMYSSHGYSNIVLQVMCDNYSHKRNSKATIEKALAILLNLCPLEKISQANELNGDNYYFLPDKGDEALFDEFLENYKLEMKSRKDAQNKYPDIVFKINGQIYICELKTMKGSGGGQDKQMSELIRFIKYSEAKANFHYLAFMDGSYPNKLLDDTYNCRKNKTSRQYADLKNALKNNPQNYFMNTAGFTKFVEDILNEKV